MALKLVRVFHDKLFFDELHDKLMLVKEWFEIVPKKKKKTKQNKTKGDWLQGFVLSLFFKCI